MAEVLNGPDVLPVPPSNVATFIPDIVHRLELVDEKLASEKGAYMARCKELRGDIKALRKEAKDNGLDLRALKELMQSRADERRAAARRRSLDRIEIEALQQYALAAGTQLALDL